MSRKKKVYKTIYVDEDISENLQMEANKEQRSFSSMVGKILREHYSQGELWGEQGEKHA